MNAKEIFNLAVRLLGLVLVYHATRAIANIWFTAGNEIIPAILSAACYCGVAWWLLRGGQPLVSRAYPDVSNEAKGGEISGTSRSNAGA